ncbi:glutathione S-transferase family protein [Glacieibacterium megasporae]|uniref:glutathione S-transferase family protein n=1 Tax=Glacieibacterium megasporae TaxID=2835787 RepID=UPI001C1E691B
MKMSHHDCLDKTLNERTNEHDACLKVIDTRIGEDLEMLLYDAGRPNPRAVRMFLLEKGVTIPVQDIDVDGGENRRLPYTNDNPAGQVPALRLDDGTCLAETGAIFQYIDEIFPEKTLIGVTAQARAETRMWQRRIELGITEHLYAAFHYGKAAEMYRTRMRILPEAVSGLIALTHDGLNWLDQQMIGRSFIVPDRLTIVDIILYCAVDFGSRVGQAIDPELATVGSWFARMAERPSAVTSLHPTAKSAGMRL